MKFNLRQLLLALGVTLLTSCSTPATLTDKPLMPYDNHTKYRVDESDTGFVIVVAYSRYLGHAESEAMATECKSALNSIAFEYAQKQSKKIETINDQRTRFTVGYSALSGVGSCSARAEVAWQK